MGKHIPGKSQPKEARVVLTSEKRNKTQGKFNINRDKESDYQS